MNSLRFLCCLLVALFGQPIWAETVVPLRTIRANALITEADVTLRKGQNQAGFASISEVVGQEARKVLYAGRPILFDEIGPPSIILRNQIVQVHFQTAGLRIVTEARALDRGAVGDRIRVMNLTSRSTLFGQVKPDGSIHVRTP